MPQKFDPYLQWLGIRDSQRPPNHYRLLGLEVFETDASVIAMSADRQMAHLRNFKTGPEADLAERLLNELSTARICLLKPERKAAYDAQLRALLKPVAAFKLTATAKPLVTAKSVLAANPRGTADVAPISLSTGSTSVYSKSAIKAAWKPWAVLAGLVILCIGLTMLLVNKNPPALDESIAANENDPAKKKPGLSIKSKPQLAGKSAEVMPVTTNIPFDPEEKSPKSEPSKKGTTNEREENTVVKPQPEQVSGANGKKQPNEENPKPTERVPATPPNIDTTALLGEVIESSPEEKATGIGDPKKETVKKPEDIVIAKARPVEPAKPARIPVPDKAAVTAKEKEIRDIFADEYKSQKPEVKASLATKLYQSSIESKGDSVMRYVLLNEARANAILGGEIKLAVEICNALVKDFELDDGPEKFLLFSKMLAGPGRPMQYILSVIVEVKSCVDSLQAEDNYEEALRLSNMALAAARTVRDAANITDLSQRIRELSLSKQAYQKAKLAKQTLEKDPTDPAANETWGMYVCFMKGDFNQGMPYLARGESAIAKTAAREISLNKAKWQEILVLADDWWEFSEKSPQDQLRTANMKIIAERRYLEIFDKLTGIDKVRVEKRLAELSKLKEQKSKQDLDTIVAHLIRNKWTVFSPDNTQEALVFRPDGSISNRVFTRWTVENNQFAMTGSVKQGDSYIYTGKIIKFNPVEFEIEYTMNKVTKWTAKVKISN